MTRWTRFFAALALAFGLGGIAAPALAQGPNQNDTLAQPETEEESKGEPMYGYVATAFLASAAIFAICKSARR